MKDKKKIILSVLGIFLLVLVTVGVTYAVFTYTKLGTTENTVTTGTLKFLYTENTGVGAGINIENAFPVSDAVGKSYDTDKYVFDFSVEATNSGSEEIPYEITLRKKSTSTLSNSNVKVYLTDMTGDSDTQIVAPTLYSDLIQTTIDVGEEVEKTIYNGTVLGGELNYLKDFRLRMWIDEKSNQDDINGKTFTILVNVYSNVPLVSEEEINSRNDVGISSITADEQVASEVENLEYNYEIILPKGTYSTSINVETIDPNSEVRVEKMENLSYADLGIKRTSISKKLSLTVGDNYFKITVISENKEKIAEYILNVISMPDCDSMVNMVWNFDYTGNSQQYRVICPGNYKLETWGAQGGSATSTYHGGYGAYASGIISITKVNSLFIEVGGQGTTTNNGKAEGGYNGGGYGYGTSGGQCCAACGSRIHGSGGGATHIATKAGLLSTLKDENDNILLDDILIVSGGGGAGVSENSNDSKSRVFGIGGSAGGIKGNSAITNSSTYSYIVNATGGTQTAGGKAGYGYQAGGGTGSFGLGQGGGSACIESSGGGAGFYGGGLGYWNPSAGGSSYIGNQLLTNKVMYCYNCTESDEETTKTISTTNVSDEPISNYAKTGNGYAKITYLGK